MKRPCPACTKNRAMNENDKITLRLSNIYCQKLQAIAVRKGRIDSCSQIVFTCLNIPTFSELSCKIIVDWQAEIAQVSLLTGELFWAQTLCLEKKKKTVTRTNLLKCSGWFLVWWRFIRYWLIITYCKWSDWNSKGGVNSVFQASKPRIKICIDPRRVRGYYCLCKDRVRRDISYYYFSLAWINAENIIFDTPSLLFNYYLSNFWIVVIAGWRSQFSHLFVYHCITV